MEKFKRSWEAELISSYMRSLDVGLFTTRTVGELLWGYEDSLLEAARAFLPELDDVFGLFYKVALRQTCCFSPAPHVCGRFRSHFPSLSWFLSQRNASNDGRYVVFTGEEDYRDFARVDTWKGER